MENREARAYGSGLADCFGLKKAADCITIDRSAVAVTRISCDAENNGMTAPIPYDDAFLVTVQLRDCAHHDLWVDGGACRTGPLRRGDVSIYDLRTNPTVYSTSPFRNMHFYLPRALLNHVAEQEGRPRIDELPNDAGMGLADPVIGGLGLSLEGAFARPDEVTRIFVDHVTSAIASYLARLYDTRPARREERPPALSARQQRIAQEMIAANLSGDIATADLASACGTSISFFRRGFQRATGTTPQQWLMLRRLDRAGDLLRRARLSLPEIARRSGFADVRHMRRVFAVMAGSAASDSI